MQFTGWEDEDFEVFSVPDFAGRMGAIRATLKPKLIGLAEDLTPRLEALLGLPTFPHVAQHMRRRVNPPAETWVAYARDRKGYKRWTHYRIAVSEGGLRVTVFVEDDADDKAGFGARLQSGAADLLSALGPDAPVLWYTLGNEPIPQARLSAAELAKAGDALQRLKTVKFQAGVPLPRAAALAMTPAEFEEWALEQMTRLKPVYLAGVG